MRIVITSLLLAGIAVTGIASDASAQGRKKIASRHIIRIAESGNDLASLPLTVNRRSWLDPGNSAPPGGGSGPAYMSATTAEFAKTQDKIFAPDRFGNAALPGQPYVPGRTVPVVSFYSNPDGTADIDNVMHYQPY